MNDDLRGGVRDLCRAIHELLDVFDRQHEQAEEARRRSEASRAVFDRMMESYRKGGEASSQAEGSQSLYQALRSGGGLDDVHEEIRNSAELSRRWETGFCDVYESLIRLYACADARPAVDRMVAQVRAIRLLQTIHEEIELSSPSLPSLEPLTPPVADDDYSLEAFRTSRADRVSSFMRGMDDHARAVGDSLMERVHLTRGHLEELLSTAEGLGGG